MLPHLCTLLLRKEEAIALLHTESLIPSIDMGQCTVHASHIGRVNILCQEHIHILFTVVACPDASVTEEEELIGSEVFLV